MNLRTVWFSKLLLDSWLKNLRLGLLGLLLATLLVACGETTPTATLPAPTSTTIPILASPTVAVKTASSATATPQAGSTSRPITSNTTIASTPVTASATGSLTGSPLPTPTPLTSESLLSYLTNKYDFGMAYPSQWKVTESDGRVLFTGQEPGYGISVDIGITPAGQTSKTLLQAYLTDFLKQNPDTAVSNPYQGQGWGGLDTTGAYIIFPTPNDPTHKIKAFVEKVINADKIYTVIASTDATKYTEREGTLQICLNSFLPIDLAGAGKNFTDVQTFQDLGVKLNYPKTWDLKENTVDTSQALNITAPQAPGTNITLQIASGTDPSDFNKQILDQVANGAGHYLAIQYSPEKLKNPSQTMARMVILSISGVGIPIYRFLYSIADTKSGAIYSLQNSAIAVHYLESADAFAAAANSFTVN